eukprot:GHVT01009546.1.p1 GENE.GHVT01009546.1~~GHVT01009546.1.p1  ORF type:complete len:361 (+),score=40.14 GHVT01009546.1:209-1291(+)
MALPPHLLEFEAFLAHLEYDASQVADQIAPQQWGGPQAPEVQSSSAFLRVIEKLMMHARTLSAQLRDLKLQIEADPSCGIVSLSGEARRINQIHVVLDEAWHQFAAKAARQDASDDLTTTGQSKYHTGAAYEGNKRDTGGNIAKIDGAEELQTTASAMTSAQDGSTHSMSDDILNEWAAEYELSHMPGNLNDVDHLQLTSHAALTIEEDIQNRRRNLAVSPEPNSLQIHPESTPEKRTVKFQEHSQNEVPINYIPAVPPERVPLLSPLDPEAIKQDLLNLAEEMRESADTYGRIIKEDNKRLELTSEVQQSHLDSTNRANVKARKIAWSGSLSFFCTMIMLAAGVLVFFFMLFFILVTSG